MVRGRKSSPEIEAQLITLLKGNGPMERDVISKELGYARTTVYDHLQRLKLRHIVYNKKKKRGRLRSGRCKVVWGIVHE